MEYGNHAFAADYYLAEKRREEGGEGRLSIQDRSADVGGVSDKPVVVLPMLGIGELGGVCSHLGLRLLEDALDVGKWDALHLPLDVVRYRILEVSEVAHVRRGSGKGRGDREAGALVPERPSPGSAAVRKRTGAEGETFSESVPAGVEGDVGAAAKAAIAGFL